MAVNFDLNLLYKLYQHDSLKGGTKGGLIDSKSFNGGSYKINGDKVTVTEADGDTFTYSWSQLSAKDAESIFADRLTGDDLIGEVANTGRTGGESAVTDDKTVDNTSGKTREEIQTEMDELRKKIDVIKNKITENNAKIDKLDEQIDAIYGDIEKKVSEYIDKAEDIQEELKEQVKKATQEEIQKYKSGQYKTTGELHEAIKKDVENILSSSAISGLMTELEGILNSKKGEADPLISEKNTLEAENQSLNLEYNTLTAQERNLEENLHGSITDAETPKEGELQAEDTKHEPQGFAIKGSDGSTTQFDFFVDRDNNGQLSDSSEFLGAQSYASGGKDASWGEMKALDTNGDGFVTVDELSAGNVHVVMTTVDKNGNKSQKAVEATAAFGENTDFKINTKQHETNSQSDVPVGFNDFAGNELLGNFDVTFNGQTYTGYQTADTAEYLNANYTFSSGDATNDTKDILNNAVISGSTSFKYDISKLIKGVENKTEQDLLKYAEDICAQNGITFQASVENTQAKENSGENAQNAENQFLTATTAQQMMAQELKDLEEEIKNFDLAA